MRMRSARAVPGMKGCKLIGAVCAAGVNAVYAARGGAVLRGTETGKAAVVRYGEAFAPLPDGGVVRQGGKLIYEHN